MKMKDLLREFEYSDGSPISSTSRFKKNEAKKWLNSFLKTTRMEFEFVGTSKVILRDDIHSVELTFGPLQTDQE